MKTARFKWVLCLALALLACVLFTSVMAQGTDGVIYQKKTVYNFADDTITGDLTRPDEEFLTGRKLAHHKSLIRIREDFKVKVLQSAKDL